MERKTERTSKNFILTGADGGVLYTLIAAVPLVFSIIFSVILVATSLSANEEFLNGPVYTYLSYGISSLALLTVILYTKKRKNLDFALSVNLKKCSPVYYLLAVLLAFGALFGLGWVNDLFISFLQNSGFSPSEITLPKNGFWDFILCTVIICILPAFFEESVFRGLLLNGARRGGDLFAVISCGLLFSLFHKNPSQTIYQFIIGATLALLALKSGSLIPGIIFHFLNNFYLVAYYFLAPEGYAFYQAVQIILCILGIICFALSVAYLLIKCKKPQREADLDSDYSKKISDKKTERKNFLIFAIPGIFACLVFWIVNLF